MTGTSREQAAENLKHSVYHTSTEIPFFGDTRIRLNADSLENSHSAPETSLAEGPRRMRPES